MNKFLAPLMCLLLVGATPVAADKGPVYEPTSIVKVVCTTKDNQVGSGTAFRIRDGVYITATHVATIGACTVNGIAVTNTIVDYKHDIAEFEGPLGGLLTPYSCDGFKAHKDYLSVGYAFGADEQTIEPIIAAPFEEEGYQTFAGEHIPGMSGGPVYGYDGKVHGIVNMRWPARSMSLSNTFVCKEK